MAETGRKSPNGEPTDETSRREDADHKKEQHERSDASPKQPTGAGREADPYGKLPGPPEDTRGEVF